MLLPAFLRRIGSVAYTANGIYSVRLVLGNPELSLTDGGRCRVDFLAF